jgi:hypothetical protein
MAISTLVVARTAGEDDGLDASAALAASQRTSDVTVVGDAVRSFFG